MKKEKYERTELEVIAFTTEDVIMTSGLDNDDYEGWNPNDPGGSGGSGSGYEGWMPH